MIGNECEPTVSVDLLFVSVEPYLSFVMSNKFRRLMSIMHNGKYDILPICLTRYLSVRKQ